MYIITAGGNILISNPRRCVYMDKIISINIGMLTEVGSGNKVTDYSSISKCRLQIYLIIHYTSDQ